MRYINSCLLFFCSFAVNAQYEYDAQKLSKTTAYVVDSFAVSTFSSYYCAIGFHNQFHDEPFGFENYFNHIPKKELLYLTKHPNPYLRVYAFHFLLQNKHLNEEQAQMFISTNCSDISRINTGTWCLSDSAFTFDVYIDLILQTFENEDALKHIHQLILNQRPLLPSTYRDGLLAELAPDPQYYSYIQSIAQDQNNYWALVALTKYKNEKDIPLIINFTQYPTDEYFSEDCLRANLFSHFYHPSFIPFIDQIIDNFPNNEKILFCEYLINAILACPKEFQISRLEKIYDNLKVNTQNDFRDNNIDSFITKLRGTKDEALLPLVERIVSEK